MRLTLRTLLAYIDDTLDPARAREIGQKVAENPSAQELIDRIKRVTRRRGLATPPTGAEGSPSDPNTVAEYLSDTLPDDQVSRFEETCLESDVHLAEVAACHQILTLVLSEQIRVPPTARKRMYQLVKGRESIPDRKPGNTIPVGGVREDVIPDDRDDTDAPFLLGMSAYSQSDPRGRQAVRLGGLALLLVLLGLAVWMAVPAADRVPPAELVGYVVAPTSSPKSAPPPQPAPKGDKPGPVAMPKPDEASPADKKAIAMPARPEPSKELVPTVPPPKADRVPVGKLDKAAAVVVRKPAGSDAWERVPAEDPVVFGADRLIALPGSKAPVRLDLDVSVELWGSLPELFPAPIYESSVTPAAPPDGFDADLTVHVGRVYLTTRRPGGAKVRLRFDKEVWDVILADAKTEVVFELALTLNPGALPEPPRTSAGLAVREGSATLQYRQQPPAKLAKGGEAYWDSKGGKPEVRPAPEAGGASRASYWTKIPVAPDAQDAEAALTGLDLLAKAMANPKRVHAAFEEALQLRDDRPATRAEAFAARIAVLGYAAIGDVPGLVFALADPIRPILRMTAIEGIRNALAADPALTDRLRRALADRQKLTDDEAAWALHMLRGFTPEEAADPAVLDRLVATLSSPAICLRELAINGLAGLVNPRDRAHEALFRAYDAGAPPEVRDPVYRQWLKRAEEIKAQAKKGGSEVAPPPKAK